MLHPFVLLEFLHSNMLSRQRPHVRGFKLGPVGLRVLLRGPGLVPRAAAGGGGAALGVAGPAARRAGPGVGGLWLRPAPWI